MPCSLRSERGHACSFSLGLEIGARKLDEARNALQPRSRRCVYHTCRLFTRVHARRRSEAGRPADSPSRRFPRRPGHPRETGASFLIPNSTLYTLTELAFQSIIVRAQGEAKSAELIGEAMKKNKGFLQLRRLEAARDIATLLQSGGNRVMLDSQSLLLDGMFI